MRVGLHSEIPVSYAEAYHAPIDLLLQLETVADIRDRIARRRRLIDLARRVSGR